MEHRAAGAALVIVGAIFMVFALFWATGAPSAPTAQLSGTINPSQAQSFQLTFTTTAGSTIAPNGVNQLPPDFVYSISETNAQGGTTVVAQSQSVAAKAASAGWPEWTLTGTVAVSTVALCSSSCGATVSNITVTVQAFTQGGGLSSPVSTIVFSSSPVYSTAQAPTPAPAPASYWEQFLGAGLLGVGLVMLGVSVIFPMLMGMKWVGAILSALGAVSLGAFFLL